LEGRHVEHVLGSDEVVVSPAGQPEEGPLVAQAAGVVDELANRDRYAEVGHLRDVLADIVVQPEPGFGVQEQGAESGELLGDRGEVEDRARGDRDVLLQVGHAVTPAVDDLAILNDRQRRSRRVRPIPGREELVDFFSESWRE